MAYLLAGLIPLFLIIGLVWFFFAGRRNRSDETGRATVQQTTQAKPEVRAQGREA